MEIHFLPRNIIEYIIPKYLDCICSRAIQGNYNNIQQHKLIIVPLLFASRSAFYIRGIPRLIKKMFWIPNIYVYVSFQENLKLQNYFILVLKVSIYLKHLN